jgi:endonuclease YncB( thermonuclease family)
MSNRIDWSKVTLDNTKVFTLRGSELECKVVDVYDGDTITLAVPVAGDVYAFKCRLYGIDTPEIRTNNLDEKEIGIKARDELRFLILDTVVRAKFIDKPEKYGRPLVTIFDTNKTNINDTMINRNLAHKYTGGKKKGWKGYKKQGWGDQVTL